MIRLRGRKVSAEVRAFVRWLAEEIGVRHDVDVHVVGSLDGFFDAPGKCEHFRPYVVAAQNDGLLDTIAHEMVHYEQWRDKRERTERGVAQRAAALVRRWQQEAA